MARMGGQLIYDGDCGFCRKCIERWRQIAGPDAVAVPYQTAAAAHPEIPLDEFRRAVQFIDEGGRRTSGAEAIIESLREVPGQRWLASAYHRFPLFASAADWIYREVAGHRKSATWITRLLWGASLDLPQYQTSVWLFRRLLALVFAIAFLSFGVQARGLIGSQGILPLGPYLDAVYGQLGASAWRDVPTVFWWWRSDAAIAGTCWAGVVLAMVCLFGFLQRPIFAVLFVLYLSLVTGGQAFMGYQWDYLLLECGFLAIFLTPSLPRVFLMQWLLFRLMFESGCVKLLSHDATWANFTALAYHYQTQPLPTPLAWYAMQAPLWFQKLSTASVFAIELGAPFLIFGPRRMKQAAAAAFVLLQTFILLTGNYAFFNWLSILLCVLLLDDVFWGQFLARVRRGRPIPAHPLSGLLSAVLTAGVLFISGAEIAEMFSRPVPGFARRSVEALAPFGVINSYGLFANMTTIRIEIEVQGSDDGEHWQSYGFPYKPGDPSRPPRWVAPHQPRLDWQMWFAALGNYRENPWFANFVLRLLTASPDVLRLMERDPFNGKPPKYVRALAYEYRFGDIHDFKTAGLWWRRDLKGLYFPSAALREH